MNTMVVVVVVQMDALMGPKHLAAHERKAKVVLDLHTSTSNTQILLLMKHDDVISHTIAAYLMSLDAAGISTTLAIKAQSNVCMRMLISVVLCVDVLR
jgi:hypothetical protein